MHEHNKKTPASGLWKYVYLLVVATLAAVIVLLYFFTEHFS